MCDCCVCEVCVCARVCVRCLCVVVSLANDVYVWRLRLFACGAWCALCAVCVGDEAYGCVVCARC